MLYDLGMTYVFVFIVTMLPAVWLINKTIQSGHKNGCSNLKTLRLFVLAIIVWFLPSILTFATALVNDAPLWTIVFVVGVFILGIRSFILRMYPNINKKNIVEKAKELFLISTLLVIEKLLVVSFLAHDDEKAISLISRFRGEYVTWAENTSGVPREIDQYDSLSSTIHVAIFLRLVRKDWMVGYGRLLFGCRQIIDKYSHVLNGSEIRDGFSVEISRLLVVPNIYGYAVRGTKWSAFVQLLIYRSFFQACESREATEWWAVLGKGLHRLLRGFGFPFSRVNDLTGEDAAGTYYAVKMNTSEGRASLMKKSPLLYKWFCAVENEPVCFVRMNGRQDVPINLEPETSC